MFTGIVECLGTIISVEKHLSNLTFTMQSSISAALRVDQSVSHDGVCLTVVGVNGDAHQVTAVQETLNRTSLQNWRAGLKVNLERSLMLGDRLDGHLVQGHIDEMGTCIDIQDQDGSHLITFSHNPEQAPLLVNKGSIAVNGVSLTVVNPTDHQFSVSIIPFTWDNTSFRNMHAGDPVNLEFDIMGKYFARMMKAYVSN